MAKYRRTHVVARSYIELFAIDGRVQCHFVRDGSSRLIGTKHVAVRKEFYTERRPDGSRSTAFEQALSPLEGQAVEVMRLIDDRWPLCDADRATLSEYLGIQAIRSPAYRKFFDRVRRQSLDTRKLPLRPEQQSELEGYSESDHFRLDSMMSQISKIGSLIGSLHWSLIRFRTPRLLSSDHPLVPVPLTQGRYAAPAPVPGQGFLNTIEFRFPISPARALLLCWRDAPDDYPVFDGKLHHMKSTNAGLREQAEEHWFHRADISAPCATGALVPLSFELFPDYEWADVVDSERRRRVGEAIGEMIEAGDRGRMQMIRVTRKAREPLQREA